VYSARDGDGPRLRFGSSGLLYRSNKLMFDHDSRSLWHQLTGEPVLGRAAAEPRPLVRLPSAVATWREWRERHPATTVVRLAPAYGARWGFVYEPGAADRKRAGVRFPVWPASDRLPRDEEVFGLRLATGAKAWPLERLLAAGVVNDVAAGQPIVLVAEPAGRAVRAFARGDRSFARVPGKGELTDQAGLPWRVTETALVPPAGSAASPLPRLAASHALWFGWYGLVPETELGLVSAAP
jgi:hypothetical protein